jgi:hypothetical protein
MTRLAIALCAVALALTACGSDPAPTKKAEPVAAEPTTPDPAASMGVHDLADVVKQYHLKAVPDDDYYIATLPDGTECDVDQILTTRSDVQFASEMGDVLAVNADMSIGFEVGGDKQATCLAGLNEMLGYQP